jgi:hypothetical protein
MGQPLLKIGFLNTALTPFSHSDFSMILRILASFAGVSIGLTLTVAQINVPPGDGTLAAAIAAARPCDTLQLTGGAEYAHSSSSSIALLHKPITIQVEPGASQRAIITGKSKYLFMIMDGAALTLKGLEIHGLVNNVPTVMSMLKFDGSPDPHVAKIGAFRFEDCVFHDFADNIVHGMTEATCRGLIQDSVFVDNVIVYNAQAFLQYKHVNLRHLEMKNSTIYRIQGLGLKIGKIGYRCILVGSGKPYIALYDSTITPTGFIDHCTMNDMGDIHGHIQVDDAFHKLTISNCIISNQDRMIGHPLISDLVALQPTIYVLNPRPDTAAFISNVCFWKTAPPNADVGGTQWIGYAFHDTITIDPGFRDTAHGDFTLPQNSPLRTYGTDGGPIGDPRWTKTTTGTTQEPNTPKAFELSQNFPNPFNPSTIIGFQLYDAGNATLKVFDTLGREIAVLVNSNKQLGSYHVQWNGNGFPSGIYFYQLTAGNVSQVKTMVLVK